MKVKVSIDSDATHPQAVTASIEYAVSVLEKKAEEAGVALDWSALDVWARHCLFSDDFLVTVKAPVLK